MVYISSCCGCFGLEMGCTITAVLQIIAGAIAMVCKSYVAVMLKKQIMWDDDPNWTYYKVSVVAAVVSALHIIFGCILYTGVQKKHTRSLVCWIFFMLLAITGQLIYLIMVLIQSIQADGAVGEIMGKFIFGLLVAVIEGYLVAVVYSFYQMMKSDNSMNGY